MTQRSGSSDEEKLDRVTPRLGTRFEEALFFAARKHSGQTRKQSQVPYIAHVLSVTALVLEAGGDEDQAIAAVLHDVVEDCGGAPVLAEIRAKFGDRVANVVDGCTDTDAVPKPPWRARKEHYLRHLREAGEDVRLVSAADKLHNVRSIVADYRYLGEAVWERFAGRREGTLWYYRAVLDILRQGPGSRLVDELERAVLELERIPAQP
jgi:(p)ppGpp synthase/HD superfamily hydrolase